jgi:hypothetical protein
MSNSPTRTPSRSASRWAIALLVFLVLMLVVVAVGDVLFAGTSDPGPMPTATPTSLLAPRGEVARG